ncbi:hypothetical protein I2562_003179 [Escherichia coli]
MDTDNYFFRVPATRGIQGGIEQYMLTVPMVVLRRILAMDNDGDVMDRSQREANKTRAKKNTELCCRCDIKTSPLYFAVNYRKY